MKNLKFILNDKIIDFNFDKVYVIGYAGRDMKKTQEHIDELERELGVKPPKRIPTIFEVSKEIVTQDTELKFVGGQTSGEVEYIILIKEGKIYITVGSDHTDRGLESVSIFKSKQVCLKPIAKEIWDYDDVKDHWDSIRLISNQVINGKEIEYQNDTLGSILPVEKIITELKERVGDIENSIIYSGTVPLVDGFKYGNKFNSKMVDDVLGKTINLNYDINVILEEER
ncbi:MAG: DUF2848 domain-containing protein [Peptoniphilus sp.]|uniref:DUF2848 family protein n=1 Tax=Peptoniphilus sp. TaxID=1971214 RepID=UPI0025FA69E5|nr:DUF2848 family protein [Peptoniphilus sp.]MCI5643696.1 DUF2848 domain-containing protein [Peptoniphilus sp.]MDY3902314.1 DUF2848 family protein [Peptoniphilus sp.]